MKSFVMSRTMLSVLSCVCAGTAMGQPVVPAAVQTAELPPPPVVKTEVRTGPEADQRVAWWRKARVGMFIHFGLYAIPGKGEWVMWNRQIPHEQYAKLADEFSPDPTAPYQWASVAKRAGFKYAVLTAKHHDGYSLFNSTGNEFNSAKRAANQDIVRTFVDATRSEGLRTGLYYSPLDWRFPGYFFPDLYLDSAIAMRRQYHREIDDLATKYGPIDLLWFDGGGKAWLGFGGVEFKSGVWRRRPLDKPYTGQFDWHDDQIVNRLRAAQPGIIINDRTDAAADWHSREGVNRLGDYDDVTPWELCFTLAGSWGYQPNAKVRPLSELVSLVTRVVTRDGNALINVGPAPNGSIPAEQIEQLEKLGLWLGTHGEAIYDTRGGPFLPVATVGSTRSGKNVFLHILPDDQGRYPISIGLPAIDGMTLKDIRQMGSGQRLRFQRESDGSATITPAAPGNAALSIILRLSYSKPVETVKARELPAMQVTY